MSVYFAQRKHGGLIKIGWSQTVKNRLYELHAKLIGAIPGNRATEHEIHERFAYLRVHGEWFEAGEDLLTYIRSEAQKHIPDARISSVGIRMPPDLLLRIKNYQEKIRIRTKAKISFNVAAISLIENGLKKAMTR